MTDEIKKAWTEIVSGIKDVENFGEHIDIIQKELEKESDGEYKQKYETLRNDYIKRFGEKLNESRPSTEILDEQYDKPDKDGEYPDFEELDFNADTE